MVEGIKKEPLGFGKTVYTTDEYRAGTDGILLSDFARAKPSDVICDLGCGSGIISLVILRDRPNAKVYGVDIQKDACFLANAAAKENGYADFTAVNCAAAELKNEFTAGTFSLVVSNPPYKNVGAGIPNENEARRIARHETDGTLAEFCAAAKYLLKSGGRFCMCHRPERLADVFTAFRENRIEPKILRTVHQRRGTEPWLILVEGRKDGKAGMRIAPPLYIEENGQLSDEVIKIYGPIKSEE